MSLALPLLLPVEDGVEQILARHFGAMSDIEDGVVAHLHDLTTGERLATVYLRKRGYEILHTNWKCAAGEADIVCRDGEETVLVEVKTRLAFSREAEIIPEP